MANQWLTKILRNPDITVIVRQKRVTILDHFATCALDHAGHLVILSPDRFLELSRATLVVLIHLHLPHTAGNAE